MQRFHFVLLPRFSLVAFSCAIDALRGANQTLGETFYEWQAVSAEGNTAISTSGIEVPTAELSTDQSPNVIVLCGGDQSHTYRNSSLTHWLHGHAKQGKQIGSISDGAFVAAEAGLFDKVRSTIHWKCFDAYRERFPNLDTRPSMMEVDGNRFSCAGGTSSLDLMLHFITDRHGADVSSQIANNYFHDTIRDGSNEQHITNAFRMASRNPTLSNALLIMEQNLEAQLQISKIADRLKISRRQLDRIFQKQFSETPQSVYRSLRLTRASGLLLQTNMSVTEIALGCGFQSASHLSKYFNIRYGVTPGNYRKQNAPY